MPAPPFLLTAGRGHVGTASRTCSQDPLLLRRGHVPPSLYATSPYPPTPRPLIPLHLVTIFSYIHYGATRSVCEARY
eukprot:1290412-Rhodomonas_salina.1